LIKSVRWRARIRAARNGKGTTRKLTVEAWTIKTITNGYSPRDDGGIDVQSRGKIVVDERYTTANEKVGHGLCRDGMGMGDDT
jgi:hypothetical protein